MFLKVSQQFEFHSGVSELKITAIDEKGAAITPTEIFGFLLARPFSQRIDGCWEASRMPDSKILEFIAAFRSKGWGLLCSDVVVVSPKCAIRTYLFEKTSSCDPNGYPYSVTNSLTSPPEVSPRSIYFLIHFCLYYVSVGRHKHQRMQAKLENFLFKVEFL